MSNNTKLMDTEIGGESGQYEGSMGLADEQKKSGGQFGTAGTTTDPSKTEEGEQKLADRGEQTAENIRYGQGISEGGMGGMTTSSTGQTSDDGYGKVNDDSENMGSEATNEAQGYGSRSDVDDEIGA